jgi:hypothetical protein
MLVSTKLVNRQLVDCQFSPTFAIFFANASKIKKASVGKPFFAEASKGKVENIGFEPMTPCLQSRCSSQLS